MTGTMLNSRIGKIQFWLMFLGFHITFVGTASIREVPMPVTIREQSDQLKAAAAERLPAEVTGVFDRSIQDLLNQGVPPGAVAVGDTLESFTLSGATGEPVTLDQLTETGPAVIVFYRGGWCPYCNLALRTYQNELLPELAAFDARLVAISPQSPDQSLSTAEKAGLEFTVLSDPASRLAQRIGIAFQQADDVLDAQRKLGLDLTKVNAEGSAQLPMPTVLIVDSHRTVRFVDVQPDYTARTEVADILAALANLGTGQA
jgi:peroxiredoxin